MKSAGTYEVLGSLARGGMAELQLARARGPHGFEKVVVLKRIHPHLADDPGFVEMFLDEARLAAQLDHPNVVQVFDIGEGEDGVFFAMEYLRGADLRQLLQAQGGALPLRHALTIGVGAAAGLHHAHRKVGLDGRRLNVIHRDVSPTNVIVTYEGAVKLLDFGIAKAATNRHHSAQSSLKGKVAYMSPEQCEGGKLDARSDLFSLGAVLYELTTGVKPFEGNTEFALMNAIVNEPVVRPGDRVADYPAELERILVKAMALRAEDRYATAAALRADLEAFAGERGLVLSATDLGEYATDRVPPRETVADPPPTEEESSIGARTPATVSRAPLSVTTPPPSRTWGRAVALAGGAAAVTVTAVLLLRGGPPDEAPVSTPTVDARPDPKPEPAVAEAKPEPEPEPDRLEPAEPATNGSEPREPASEVPEPEIQADPPTKKSKRRRRPKKKTEEKPAAVDGDGWVPIRR